MSTFGTRIRNFRRWLGGSSRRIPPPAPIASGTTIAGTPPPLSQTRPRRMWLRASLWGLAVALGAWALWNWWPRAVPPILSRPVWEKELVAKGIQFETKRLDALLHDDLSVDAFWDTLIRPSCQIYWVTREDPDQVTNLSLGDPALAYNQLALIAGYGKRMDMPELHVGICSFKMATDRKQLETLSLQLKAK